MSSPVLRFRCPHCQKQYQWLAQNAGKTGVCKQCKNKYSVPAVPDTGSGEAPPVLPPLPPPIGEWSPLPPVGENGWPPLPPPAPPPANNATVHCPACATAHLWDRQFAGMTLACSQCGQAMLFPHTPPPPLPPPAPAYLPPVNSTRSTPPARAESQWPAEPTRPPSEKEAITLDRTRLTRRRMRNYFSPPGVLPYLIFAVAVLLVPCSIPALLNDIGGWLGCCVVPLVLLGAVGAGLLFLAKTLTFDDGEADRLIEDDRDQLEAAAAQAVKERLAQTAGGQSAQALPGWSEPICFAAPTARRKGEKEAPYRWVYGNDGEFRYACSNVFAIGAAGYHVVVATLAIDHTTGMVYLRTVCELQYQDIANVDTHSASQVVATGLVARLARHRLWGPLLINLSPFLTRFGPLIPVYNILNWFLREDRTEVETTTFAITSTGGSVATVTIDVTYHDHLTEVDSKLNREETDEEAVIRNRIQEVKSLLRRTGLEPLNR